MIEITSFIAVCSAKAQPTGTESKNPLTSGPCLTSAISRDQSNSYDIQKIGHPA